MLRDVAVARIQRGLGFRTDQADNIVLAMQEAQRLLERGRTLPYFLLQVGQTIAVTAGTSSYALPTGFLREESEYGLRRIDALSNTVNYLEKMDRFNNVHEFEISEDPTEVGAPLAYGLQVSNIFIRPIPDIAYTLTWGYYKAATTLTSNIENAWLEEEYGAPEVLIAKAGMLMADDLYNQVAKAKFQQMFSEAYAGMLADTFQRSAENMPLYMGGRL